MQRTPLTSSALLALAIGATTLHAHAQQDHQPGRVIDFRFASEALEDEFKLANGVTVRKSDWPTLLVATMAAAAPGSGSWTCTSTMIGPRVMLTAAHCVDDAGRMAVPTVMLGGSARRFTCEAHPDYMRRPHVPGSTRSSEDYALCMLDMPGDLPEPLASMRFDVVQPSIAPNVDDPVLLIGYGCSSLTVDAGGRLARNEPDGKLRIGDARIGTASDSTSSSAYITVRSVVGKQAAICPGDSGGPVFSGVSESAPEGARRIRAVNSAVGPVPRTDGKYDIASYLSSTAVPTFRSWSDAWLARHKHPVACGLNTRAGVLPCRP